MAYPDNIDRRIAELLEIVDRDFERNVTSDVSEFLRSLLEIKRLASLSNTGDLRYLEPSVTFEALDTWTPLPNVPTNALRFSYEVEAVSTDDVVGRLCTDPTPKTPDNLEWMLVNWQASTLDTRKEVENFKVKRSANTTSLVIRGAFYG